MSALGCREASELSESLLGVLDLDVVRSQRAANPSRGVQSSKQKRIPRVEADINICRNVTTEE